MTTSIIIGVLWAGVLHAQAPNFFQTNLVSDIQGLATITDPELVNPWGVSHSPTSPFLGFEPGEEHHHSLCCYR
jgi:hypothetical protein